jgi:dTDP-4-amino-4,6-dideoxygalactose transaminase
MHLPSLAKRQALISYLNEHHISSAFHYQPLHLSSMGRKFGGKAGDCPVTEDVSDRLLRLPFYNDLEEQDQSRVVNRIKEFSK